MIFKQMEETRALFEQAVRLQSRPLLVVVANQLGLEEALLALREGRDADAIALIRAVIEK